MKRKNKGVTLPEILIGISLAAIVGTLIISMFISSNTLFFDQSSRARQGISLNQASREITSLIKSSAGIVSQYPPSGSAQFNTDVDTLILKIPAINGSGNIISQVFDYAVITSDPTEPKILRKLVFVDAQSFRKSENKVITTTLNTLEFIYLDASNTPVSSTEAVRINYKIKLVEKTSSSENESFVNATANLKN